MIWLDLVALVELVFEFILLTISCGVVGVVELDVDGVIGSSWLSSLVVIF